MAERGWTPQKHPSLFFDEGDLEDLRGKRRIDEIARAAWGRVEEEISKGMALAMPEESPRWEWDTGADGQKSLGHVCVELDLAVTCLGLSWALDRNEVHARKARDLLLALCDFDFWTSARFFGTDYRLPWRGTLETSELSHAAACGYDWLYESLSDAERHRIRTCLLYKGVQPLVQDWADPLSRLPLSTHIMPAGNWWENCIATAGEASVALYGEHPLAERYVRLCKEASDSFFTFEGGAIPEDLSTERLVGSTRPGTYYPPNFDSEGGYWEGMGYLDVLVRTSYFAESYRRRFGKDVIPRSLMKKIADLILYQNFKVGDRMRAVNFGDTPGGFATGPVETCFLTRTLRHPGLQWFFQNCQKNFSEPYYYRAGDYAAFTYLWYDPTLEARDPRSASPLRVWPGMSVAVMRSGWGHDDTMLAFKCGVTAAHAHPDAGSFVLYSRDQMLLIDPGCCGYEMPEQNGYYQTTRAHSTLLIGAAGQVKRLPGAIVEQASAPGLGYVLGDATAPYEGRLKSFLRGILFVGSRYYVIADWVSKGARDPLQWLLHYDGDMRRDNGAYVIRKERAAVLVRMVEPSRHRLSVQECYTTYLQNPFIVRTTEERQRDLAKGEYLSITPEPDSRQHCFFTVVYPFAASDPVPSFEEVREHGWVGVRIDRGSEKDLVAMRLPRSRKNASLDGVQTDASLFCLVRDRHGRPKRVFMRAGTYLRVGGKRLASTRGPAVIAAEA